MGESWMDDDVKSHTVRSRKNLTLFFK